MAVISGAFNVIVVGGVTDGWVSAPATPPAGVSTAVATEMGVRVAVDGGRGVLVDVGCAVLVGVGGGVLVDTGCGVLVAVG